MKRSGPILRRSPLRSVSKKRSRELRLYAQKRKAFLAANRICPVMQYFGEQVFTSEIHHRNGRTGARLNDERFWLAVSRAGHVWIHNHASIARTLGWLV